MNNPALSAVAPHRQCTCAVPCPSLTWASGPVPGPGAVWPGRVVGWVQKRLLGWPVKDSHGWKGRAVTSRCSLPTAPSQLGLGTSPAPRSSPLFSGCASCVVLGGGVGGSVPTCNCSLPPPPLECEAVGAPHESAVFDFSAQQRSTQLNKKRTVPNQVRGPPAFPPRGPAYPLVPQLDLSSQGPVPPSGRANRPSRGRGRPGLTSAPELGFSQ